ncbi:hypothetical protein [Stenotrophomonas maltophilia]|uniref:hypothetical protein n=1 Tax=Stenotrophomonas maltophilia TaxID=40324 RepID=UPI0021CA53E6|nr:hypothetical protein [Stenotrophomonas maltophilia]MCU1162469.1 hypothetical protein [Stenotrophomonas maltophilia]
MGKKTSQGHCRLTGQYGRFVASHIIPKALTRPSVPGRSFIQAGNGDRPTRRFDSWYDTELVTRAGENLLADLDSSGIELLRKHQLVWSGRCKDEELRGEILWPEGEGAGMRFLPEPLDQRVLRRFLLSILWRAAQSGRPEFAEISLPVEHLEKLREMVLTGSTMPYDWYPVVLTQLMERGPNHNLAPQAVVMPGRDELGQETGRLRALRFYFDGLVINFMRPESDDLPVNQDDDNASKVTERYPVLIVKNDQSLQVMKYDAAVRDAEEQWPELIEKLSSSSEEDQMPGVPHFAEGEGLVMMHDLIPSLQEDVLKAYELLESDRSSQFFRRALARATFAYVEALIEAVRNELRSTIRSGVGLAELTPKDEETLGFLGVVGSPTKFLPVEQGLKRTFKLAARIWGLDFRLETDGEHFRDFLAAKDARNRLMHPRTLHDVEVTDEDMACYTIAGQWVQTETQRLFRARIGGLLSQMSPESRRAFLDSEISPESRQDFLKENAGSDTEAKSPD